MILKQILTFTKLLKNPKLLRYCASISENKTLHNYTTCTKLSDILVTNCTNTENIFKRDFKLYENFISEEEEKILVDEIEPKFERLRYEGSHWDDAIHDYREIERSSWNQVNQEIIHRIHQLAFPPDCQPLENTHILDLSPNGFIKPHIDSIRFCGDVIAGLSLLSDCIMRFTHEKNKDMMADAKLSRRSLYIMSGAVRYEFNHEVLSPEASQFKGQVVPRGRRISVISRVHPRPENLQ